MPGSECDEEGRDARGLFIPYHKVAFEPALGNTRTLALVYQRQISGPWSIVLHGGTPPLVKFDASGSADVLGRVGTARAWFPAVLVAYSFGAFAGFAPYVGAGLNYTWFTDSNVTAAYGAAFGGSSSTAKMKDSLGRWRNSAWKYRWRATGCWISRSRVTGSRPPRPLRPRRRVSASSSDGSTSRQIPMCSR
jgi:hypothetical protein